MTSAAVLPRGAGWGAGRVSPREQQQGVHVRLWQANCVAGTGPRASRGPGVPHPPMDSRGPAAGGIPATLTDASTCLTSHRLPFLKPRADGPLSLLDRQRTRLREASDLPRVTLGGGSLAAAATASPSSFAGDAWVRGGALSVTRLVEACGEASRAGCEVNPV